jgi:hypothetical protein
VFVVFGNTLILDRRYDRILQRGLATTGEWVERLPNPQGIAGFAHSTVTRLPLKRNPNVLKTPFLTSFKPASP